MHHRIIMGKVYRDVQLQAADTRKASQHVSAERPLSAREARAYRKRRGA